MRLFITLFYSLLLFCTIFSCRDESSSIGSKWVESSFINVVTDTCMVTLSTLLADSLATSGDTICQIGRFKDDLYGEIKTSFYAEYQVPSHSVSYTHLDVYKRQVQIDMRMSVLLFYLHGDAFLYPREEHLKTLVIHIGDHR